MVAAPVPVVLGPRFTASWRVPTSTWVEQAEARVKTAEASAKAEAGRAERAEARAERSEAALREMVLAEALERSLAVLRADAPLFPPPPSLNRPLPLGEAFIEAVRKEKLAMRAKVEEEKARADAAKERRRVSHGLWMVWWMHSCGGQRGWWWMI